MIVHRQPFCNLLALCKCPRVFLRGLLPSVWARRGQAPNGWASDIFQLNWYSEQKRLDINQKEISKLLFVAQPTFSLVPMVCYPRREAGGMTMSRLTPNSTSTTGWLIAIPHPGWL